MMVQVFTDSEPHFVSFKFLPLRVHFSAAFELLLSILGIGVLGSALLT